MKQMKSVKPETRPQIGGAMRRAFGISVPAAMVLSAMAAMVFAIAIDGCSSKSKTPPVTAAGQPSQSGQNTALAALPTPTPTPVVETAKPVVKKKAVVRRVSTVSYKSNDDGISFRYPRSYKLMPEKTEISSAWPEPVPMNFAHDGGATLATIGQQGPAASSFFKVSVNKGLTQDQCGQFAVPAPAQDGTSGNLPVDSSDESIPSKGVIHGLEFTRVENATEQTDVKYFHHFVPGTAGNGVGACYEFALGVQEAEGNTKPVDYVAMFEKLERIFSTVKIQSEQPAAVTAFVPAHPVSVTEPK